MWEFRDGCQVGEHVYHGDTDDSTYPFALAEDVESSSEEDSDMDDDNAEEKYSGTLLDFGA